MFTNVAVVITNHLIGGFSKCMDIATAHSGTHFNEVKIIELSDLQISYLYAPYLYD